MLGHGLVSQSSFGGSVRVRSVGPAMTRFGYLRDVLFLGASVSYALNRWWLKPRVASPFLHGHFNDLLLIPAALPVVLWLQRISGLREHDGTPTWPEMLLHLFVWSLVCEWVGP